MRYLRFLPRHWWNPFAWKRWLPYARWRMETYGVYYPAGKFNWKGFKLMLGQMDSYERWLAAMGTQRNKPCVAREITPPSKSPVSSSL